VAGPLLDIVDLTRAFPGVVANDSVSLDVRAGEIHAVIGENGAGKSTLMGMIYGLIQPDSGTMSLLGRRYAPANPQAARAAGIAMVFQHFSLFEALSVAENVALGMADPPPRRALSGRIRSMSLDYGLPLDPDRRVGDLSAGERQRVEILRCLLQDPKLLIMDEPTSVLTPQEAALLFATLRQLAARGTAILYISHKLEEVRALCSRATVLRRGQVTGTCDPATVSARDLAEMMVGSALPETTRAAARPGPVRLHVTGLSLPAPTAFGTPLRHIVFEARAGEVLGIGGVAGNGQDELLAALSGEARTAPGTIMLDGAPIGALGPEARRARGLRTAPEDRLGHAAAPGMSLTENTLLTARRRAGLLRRGFVSWGRARGYATEIIDGYDVRTPGPDAPARALSGGNLQKFLIGREVLEAPTVFIANQPTWGVDARAAAAIRAALIEMAARGAAVIAISQDLDELLEISDRFCALSEGRLGAALPARDLTLEEVGLMLGGAHDMHAPGSGVAAAPPPAETRAC
jgi:ABC-type uncharacterized transport system ATPase subunit